ncbi:hypothetical protein CDL12_16556 [Handroanthus impetiginosus]|uniref:F-box domain-containing protein n=1 Tax=Handroanthus impetiginosus TaxID=429701 RepID=A0A2G9GZZ1_9LAMI|nr:hypothetical protein CDL12_16556 [Handroanthus impetiginosus]
MWSNLPFDLLAKIFSYLPPESLARAKAACRNWQPAAESAAAAAHLHRHRHPPWFIALPTRSWGLSCYAHNPVGKSWHLLSIGRTISTIKPFATIGGLLLLKITSITALKLAIYNPFTKQFKPLPLLNVARTNPAVGVVEKTSTQNFSKFGFKIYVAGGMSDSASGGAIYQQTIEMYDSFLDKWTIIGPMPVEFAVRLTVWTPNESVHSNGVIYWMTSARAYSAMGFEIATNRWRELAVPMADKLEFAALVPRNGKLAVVGGIFGGDAAVWELGEDEDQWSVVAKVPLELGIRALGEKMNWGSMKCVGTEGAVCLYRDLGSGIIVRREVYGEGKWEWDWIEGCCLVGGKEIKNFAIKGFLLHPNLARSDF